VRVPLRCVHGAEQSFFFLVKLATTTPPAEESPDAVYLCGNSLGLQPKITALRMQQYFQTWQTPLEESPLPTWLDADSRACESIAPIVGALPSEVAVMETLTANLHLLMSAFYKPDIKGRHKIIIESQAFPSDHVRTVFSLIRRQVVDVTGADEVGDAGRHLLSLQIMLPCAPQFGAHLLQANTLSSPQNPKSSITT